LINIQLIIYAVELGANKLTLGLFFQAYTVYVLYEHHKFEYTK